MVSCYSGAFLMHLVPILSYFLSPLLFHMSQSLPQISFPLSCITPQACFAISDTHLGLTEIFAVPLSWPITELLDLGYKMCLEGHASKCLNCKHKAAYIIVLRVVI